MALLCVIPTALRWRRERQIMSQLENLASRLHMTSPDITGSLSPAAASAALTRINDSMQRRSTARKRRLSQTNGYDNHGFVPIISQSANDAKHHQPQITLPIFPYMYGMYPSQNEFNASIFGLDPSQLIGPMPTMQGELAVYYSIPYSQMFVFSLINIDILVFESFYIFFSSQYVLFFFNLFIFSIFFCLVPK